MFEQELEEPPEKRRRASSSNNVQSTFNYEELARAERFQNTGVVIEMDANDFTIEYVEQSKLKQPILFTGQLKELGMKIPNFDAHQLLQRIPNDSSANVIESRTETSKDMSVEDFIQEFNKSRKDRSKCLEMWAEISVVKGITANFQAPSTIRQINWKNIILPRQKFAERKLSLYENYLAIKMTGFYDTFGYYGAGEAFCVHVQSGKQYYFLIEPTSQNFEKVESYDPDSNEFFGDQVSKCTCICVEAGQTLLVPTSWIYKFYTSTDTIVYEHYFYHEFSLGLQLKLNEYQLNMTDDEIEADDDEDYMFIYQPLLWYFIADLVKKVCKRDYVRLIHSQEYSELLQQTPDPNKCYDIRLVKSEFHDKITGDPIQRTFERVDKKPEYNKMPETFDDGYLRSWDRAFHTDLSLLFSMFVNIVKYPKKARVAEGIRRPNHLLADLKRVLDRYNELQHADLKPVPWQIKPETISLDAIDNSNIEVVQIDESELDNSSSLSEEVNTSSNLNEEVEQPTSTVNFEPVNQQLLSTFANNTTIQKLANLKANDFVIRSEGNTFKIFKVINNNDAAKQNELEEIDSNEIPHFVNWIRTSYEGDFDEHAEELFRFAVNYNIPDLKRNCFDSLKSSLNEENFCQRLILAFEHEDEQFQQHIIEFTKQIDGWQKKLFVSDQWLDFSGQNKRTAKAILNCLI